MSHPFTDLNPYQSPEIVKAELVELPRGKPWWLLVGIVVAVIVVAGTVIGSILAFAREVIHN